jgi:hypothetical protein
MQRKAAEKREKEKKTKAVQADDLLVFRQFSNKGLADGVEDVSDVSMVDEMELMYFPVRAGCV